MQTVIQGFGKLVSKDEIKVGDLFAVSKGGGRAILALRTASISGTNLAIILAEIGGLSGQLVPRQENFDLVVQNEELSRLLTELLFVEPLGPTMPECFAEVTDSAPAPNGVLALYLDGARGIYLLPNERVGVSVTIDLESGERCPVGAPRHLVHWRLVMGKTNPIELYRR